ncbi:MAG: hypothetical protein ACOYMN_13745 [Roseimicrobium sp.]
MEFATAQNPTAATTAATPLTRSGAALDFTHTRSLAALADGVSLTVEWSDTLAPGSWSTAGVSAPAIVSDNGVTQQVKVTIASGHEVMRRFVRLRLTRP